MGLDIIAALSMLAALVFAEFLAAVVVALMYAGGQYLEAFAERRASREMTSLLARVPRTAVRYQNGRLEEIGLDAIAPGDRIVIRKGDVIPVDGTVGEGLAVLDQSALTGESMPIQQRLGDAVMSGSTNEGEAFHLLGRGAPPRAHMPVSFAGGNARDPGQGGRPSRPWLECARW